MMMDQMVILGGAAAIKYLFFADRGRNSVKPL